MSIALGPLLILFALGLASSGFDLFRKLLVRHLAPVPMVVLLALLMSCTIPLDKLAVGHANPPFHGLILCAGIRQGWGPFLLALVSSTLALGLQLVALKLVLVSVVETVKRGVGNLMAVVLGRAVFGEAVTPGKLLAAALMAGGVALIFA